MRVVPGVGDSHGERKGVSAGAVLRAGVQSPRGGHGGEQRSWSRCRLAGNGRNGARLLPAVWHPGATSSVEGSAFRVGVDDCHLGNRSVLQPRQVHFSRYIYFPRGRNGLCRPHQDIDSHGDRAGALVRGSLKLRPAAPGRLSSGVGGLLLLACHAIRQVSEPGSTGELPRNRCLIRFGCMLSAGEVRSDEHFEATSPRAMASNGVGQEAVFGKLAKFPGIPSGFNGIW
jgi:hypothetical protein